MAPLYEFPPGEVKVVDTDFGLSAEVFNVDGSFYAIQDMCSQEAEILSWGQVEGLEVICLRHGARFSLERGEALTAPACEPVSTYPVWVEAGMDQVEE